MPCWWFVQMQRNERETDSLLTCVWVAFVERDGKNLMLVEISTMVWAETFCYFIVIFRRFAEILLDQIKLLCNGKVTLTIVLEINCIQILAHQFTLIVFFQVIINSRELSVKVKKKISTQNIIFLPMQNLYQVPPKYWKIVEKKNMSCYFHRKIVD